MNRLTRLVFALWIVTLGSAGSPQPCEADEAVTLKPSSEIHRLTVKLSDLFDGVPAEADRDIAQAPLPGRQATYDVNVLTRVAEKYHLGWKSTSLADHVVITASCAKITSDMIREAVIAKIRQTGSVPSSRQIDITFDNRSLEVSVVAETLPDFNLNNFDFDAQTKRFRADLAADTANGVYTRPVAGHVIVKRNVPVLARRLEAGTTIGQADLDEMAIPEERINETILTDGKQLIGQELRHDTDGGEILHARDVISPRLVTRGSLVTLRIQTAFMSLTTQGKALQDGAHGDAIRVLNTQSNRVIEGTVDSAGTVRVQVNQQVAVAQ